MSSGAALPRPYLLALLLVCQTRSGSGPQIVFSWPPDPLTQTDRAAQTDVDDAGNDEPDSGTEEWSSEDDFLDHTDYRSDGRSAYGDGNSDLKQQRRNFLGIDEDGLLGLLTPDRTWNKRKFEISLNDLTFLGRPVFARKDGTWKKERRIRNSRKQSSQPDDQETTTDDDSSHQARESTSDELDSDTAHGRKSGLVMFHLVFVMKPPPLEHFQRIKDIYENVVKKFTRALKWIQAHHDFVADEVDAILSIKPQAGYADGRSLAAITTKILETSALARSMRIVYDAISHSRIASIPLLPGVSISLQIPPVTSTSHLPSLSDPPILPGIWLTTATEASATGKPVDDASSSDSTQLAKAYTLLLKSSPAKIAKDAQSAGGPIATHLPKFVAALRPTKSFFKLANEHKISFADIQLLARHLIYWRRAIAIPPLSQRDIYIVSPNADLSKLSEACNSYESNFPASIPKLPKLLAFLSGTPRPFGTLIPSPDHKDIYMLVLAWLMRNGWVTQLRTFAYIRIASSIKEQAINRVRDARASSTASESFNQGDVSSSFQDKANTSSRPTFLSRQSSDGRPSFNENSTKTASLIKSPPKATIQESWWLSVLRENILHHDLGTNLSQDERQELHAYWPILSKHLDGITALETVPTKEGLKRPFVWNMYGKLGLDAERGSQSLVDGNKGVLLTIRHW